MDYLALDLGAGSGRAIVGSIHNGRLQLDEIHRFKNKPISVNQTLHWDILFLFDQIKQSIKIAFDKGYQLQGLAIDTWGVDFGFIDKRGNLIANPVCYRDSRTNGMQEIVSKIIPPQDLYNQTGIQQISINTLYQLFSLKKNNDPILTIAHQLLFIPDLLNYFLTGNVSNEYTIASTSQLLNIKAKQWDKDLFERLGFPLSWMSEIRQPGSIAGFVKKEITDELAVPAIRVFHVGSHDTASAIGAIPFEKGMAFLSSGTWSLLGLPVDEPILSDKARLSDFSNEGMIDNKILFLQNITGLWLLQQLIAEWESKDGTHYSYEHLLKECEVAKSFQCFIDNDDPLFTHPISMQTSIEEYSRKTGQLVPKTKGEFVRCVLESLAIKYVRVMEDLKECTQTDISQLFIVGGGSRNKLLNQFIANALNMKVSTGLTEATAIGNIIQQAIANKELANREEGYSIIKNSFHFTSYIPEDHEVWRKQFNRISKI